MKKFRAAILSLIVALTVLLCGCGGGEFSNPCFFSAMHSDVTVAAYGKSDGDFKNLCIDIKNRLSKIEASVSVTDENSYISKFNRAPAGEKVQLDECAYELLTLAKKIYDQTEGYYNPAVYYSVQAFTKEKNQPFTLPSTETTDKYKQLSDGFKDIEIKAENGAYYAVKPQNRVEINGEICSMKLDLGGIAKGYAAKQISGVYDGYGYTSGYFDMGGSSVICKNSKSGGAFKLGMTNPRKTGATYFETQIRNTNLSTSGDYRNYFVFEGVRYCHIIDPTTARPVQTGITTATIIDGDPAANDAYTTAIMAMGTQKAVEFINANLSDLRVVFICEEGVVTNMPEVTNESLQGYKLISTVTSTADGKRKIVLGDSNVA